MTTGTTAKLLIYELMQRILSKNLALKYCLKSARTDKKTGFTKYIFSNLTIYKILKS